MSLMLDARTAACARSGAACVWRIWRGLSQREGEGERRAPRGAEVAFENVGCTAAIDRRRAWRQRSRDNLGVGMSVNGTALALIVLIASGSRAFALKIPIQAILTG